MSRLANVSGKEAVKAFGKAGWQVLGQVGSHVVMTKPNLRANLSIPPTQGAFHWNAASADSRGGNDRRPVSSTSVTAHRYSHP
jgi:predicted RNA binding protein YcfA (HicA-like mRNA interferase family)